MKFFPLSKTKLTNPIKYFGKSLSIYEMVDEFVLHLKGYRFIDASAYSENGTITLRGKTICQCINRLVDALSVRKQLEKAITIFGIANGNTFKTIDLPKFQYVTETNLPTSIRRKLNFQYQG